MACVVRYSFLLISICLRSTTWADANVQVTPLIGAVGNEIIIQCATDKTPQDGVAMYKQDLGSKNKQNIFYYYKDNSFTLKSSMHKGRVHVDGDILNLNVTFSNVNTIDIGLYWCEFNLEEKLTVSMLTWLWIDAEIESCPEDLHVKNALIVCAVMLLLCIIGYIFVIQKVGLIKIWRMMTACSFRR
ncbi:uncharacterized protein si:rp71-81e14.2 isoform X2 [Carassius gibelio]|uniref:uncharacterized protein si:rp71-81e14.2 isoform X2 n=1 Tax=Carassius gibelio TaxID=101364 RepID=UPI002278EF5B|nr:uncharacterized protein si:rp71-81e14.2 isoform X2 [Carassius gibelio]